MKKHPTSKKLQLFDEHGYLYILPILVAKKYRQEKIKESTPALDAFASYEEAHSKPGLLLRGLRAREGLTQEQFASLINVSQANLSKMEHGKRPIGKEMAKRIAKKFDINYQSLL